MTCRGMDCFKRIRISSSKKSQRRGIKIFALQKMEKAFTMYRKKMEFAFKAFMTTIL